MPRLPRKTVLDALVLGAGPAGLGTALALRLLGLRRLLVLEQGRIGDSFRRWPRGMRLITPSFTGNQYGALDLNSIHPSSSPAWALKTEHPTGPEYADYLRSVAAWGRVPVAEKTRLIGLRRLPDGLFQAESSGGPLWARNVVWAGGEFQHPRLPDFPGAALGRHTGTVADFAGLPGRRQVVVGGAESGIDAAFRLVQAGKTVAVLDPGAPWNADDSDPSVTLSPYTQDRLRVALDSGRLHLSKARVRSIRREKRGWSVLAGGRTLACDGPPLLATGFEPAMDAVRPLFDWKRGLPAVRLADDQSTRTPGLYLAGPVLRHRLGSKLLVFCFIYKYRGRFPVVASSIGRRLKLPQERLDHLHDYYRKHRMYLDDLSCCGDDCAC
jgi:thioredoxin reductase